MRSLKYDKFHKTDDLGTSIRREEVVQGVPVVFVVSGVNLSVLENRNEAQDFDAASDAEIEKIEISPGVNIVHFIWEPGFGFVALQ